MTTSLVENSQTIAQIEDLAAKMLKTTSVRARRLQQGGNAQVFVLETIAGTPKYVMKLYFRHPNDPRDRLETEFAGLTFLWGQGITNIPRPVVDNKEKSCAIYEFIEGQRILGGDVTLEDIQGAIDFLARLKKLNPIARSHDISPASDACYSISAIVTGIERRLALIAKVEGKGREYVDLAAFLKDDFEPFLRALTQWAKEQCLRDSISFDTQIPMEKRTLSPSDFGFHNAIRSRDGGIVFLDFEYFGWDDPTKMIADFLLHPAMCLSESMKKSFVRGTMDIFKENIALKNSLKVAYPLHGLKWCAIFLNEFIPNDFSRRSFAAATPLDPSVVRCQQLSKAKQLFNKIKETYENFPYAIG